ncbi:DMT family transporter [Hominifimenecus sp. rT4P-3]|uniref:DMT family transporter n=1 Tax=Hominifimenecus sp. rT4P-3 TaxID=3242979 RepID=UPI003DA5CFB2
MNQKNPSAGHLAASLTILIWGTTFIATKLLLVDFQPVEILFFRFFIGIAALFLACPRRLKLTDRRQEWLFAGAGICGVTLYYLLENIALTYTMASNVGVVLSVSPFFAAILTHWILREEKLRWNFFLGFLAAIAGIVLISWNGSAAFQLNPLGDLLAFAAAFVWGVYSILTRKISSLGYPTVLTTRRTFFYGLVFMIPALFLMDFRLELVRFTQPGNLFNILFLGLGASALCFVTWNYAVRSLGVLKTSVYIYGVPVITVITSALILHETITPMAILGTVLTLSGLIISEAKWGKERARKE